MNVYSLRKQIRDKKLEAKKILDGCESREMSEDESAAFDACLRDVEDLKSKVEKLSALGDEEDAYDEQEADPNKSDRSSGRVSSPNQWVERSAPAVHTAKHKYSILRAMRCAAESKPVDGFEGEVSQEIALRHGKKPQGFYMPLGTEPEFRGNLDTSTGTGAVFVLPELPFIELLRNKTVLKELGATFLTGMNGKFSIPRQSGAGTATWVAESSSVTGANQTFDQVAFVDKSLMAATNISRKFLYQSSVDAEAFVNNDLALILAIELDRAAINGSGSGAIPIGILQNTTIQTGSTSLALGTNGAAATFANLVAMETVVANANADRGSLKYLTTPAARGKLKVTQKATNYPEYVWQDNEINGYEAVATNNVPANLTKGTGTGLSGIIFANWNDLVVAQWGGVDVVVNPYSNQLSGAIQISMMLEADIQVRHPESFAIISDFLTT